MASIFAQQRQGKPDPVAIGLRVQSSLQGAVIPIGCGRYRWSGNLIDYAGFRATPVKQPGAKGGVVGGGGKGNTGQYNYYAWGIVSLCEGGIASVNRIHNGSSIDFLIAPTSQELTDLNNIGINPSNIITGNAANAIIHYGNWTDGPDSTWTGQFPSETGLAYPGQAYIIFPNLGLGNSASFPSFSFDCTWSLSGDVPALGPDANAADWIEDFLTDGDWGVQGFPPSVIGDFDTARNYWRATGLLISTALTSPTAANSHLGDLMPSLNAEFRWSNGKLDIVPYGDAVVTGNGYTYTPNNTPVYAFGPDDFLANQGSVGGSSSGKVKVGISIKDTTELPNIWRIEYLDRANLYNPVPVEHSNDADIVASGRRRYGDKKSQHWFCLADAASLSCALQLHRAWSTLVTYQFTVGRRFILADVLDLVTLTEPTLGLDTQLVRITEIQENADGSLTMTAEDAPMTASAPVYARQPSVGIARNTAIAPGSINAPAIFELPGQLSQALELQIAACGQIPDTWGGCTVWIATHDVDAEYERAGTIEAPARMGVLSASLASVSTSPSGPTLDTTHTLAVDMSESLGVLYSGTAQDLAAYATLCLVDGELIAYQNSTLTSASHYSLTTLQRGCYGTQGAVTNHSAGAPFVRIDDAIWRWTYTNPLIGKTLYFKFTSFNIYGSNEEQLADVPSYSHTLGGTPTPSGISISSATLTQVGIANTLAVTWVADPLAVSYIFDYSTDGGASYTALTVPTGLSWQVPGLQVSDVYVRVAGVNANGVAGPYLSPVHVVGPALNYGGSLGLSYNDLTSPAMQQQLDAIANEEAIILGAMSAALAANQATVAAVRSANSAVTVSTLARSDAEKAIAAQVTQLSAVTDANMATIDETLMTQSDALSALAATVVKVNASAVGIEAAGRIEFVASAGVGGGFATWNLTVSASGHLSSSASVALTANADGTSSLFVIADKFAIGDPATHTVPFQTLGDGSLLLNGVTRIGSVIKSAGVGSNGQPYMTLDFGSSPSMIVDDGV